ncbi:MAG: nucleotidyltransferase domain-containing protein [Clostridia bacterium]|nr:nucleotidyltransferase domain-containing protein [Clostridia bacterium]
MKQTILEELDKVEAEYGVRILHAVESGSRSWGFASPDSDYDVRFVYVRPARDYLRLDTPRDVIEWKLDAVLDINGWDLRKAMTLFAKGNATLFEWSHSPVVYRTTPEWERIRETALPYFSEKAAILHYYGTAMSTWAGHLTGETVRYKKYFYALRPLLAAQYIERFHRVPPVLFDELLQMDLDPALRAAIDDLLERKKVTTEGESHPQIPAIRDFIREELIRQKAIGSSLPEDRNPDWSALNRCFAEMIGVRL